VNEIPALLLSGMDRVRVPLDLSCRAGYGTSSLLCVDRGLYRTSKPSVSSSSFRYTSTLSTKPVTTLAFLYSFIQALEQIFFLFFFVGLAWAWVVLAGLCVNRARTGNYSQSRLQANQEKYAYLQETDPTQYGRRIIFEGSYIEAGPAIICGAFLGVGCAFYVSHKSLEYT
jgi:ABC-type phosphate transport system permease subunit